MSHLGPRELTARKLVFSLKDKSLKAWGPATLTDGSGKTARRLVGSTSESIITMDISGKVTGVGSRTHFGPPVEEKGVFMVVGEVGRPGSVSSTIPSSLRLIIEHGGGFSKHANRSQVLVLRKGLPARTYDCSKPEDADKVILEPGEQVVVKPLP